LYSTGTVLASTVADSLGTLHAAVTIPADVSGPHTMVAIGYRSDGALRVLGLSVTVDSSALAATGSPPLAGILAVGTGLVAASALFLTAGYAMPPNRSVRRRRSNLDDAFRQARAARTR
jgi:hypothetical protein